MQRRSARLAPTKRASVELESQRGSQATTSKRQKRTRSTINSLPVTILSHIFSYLPRQRATYQRLALVSPAFNQATVPLQYERFQHMGHLTSSAFLLTLIDRPDYAKLVKELDFTPDSPLLWRSGTGEEARYDKWRNLREPSKKIYQKVEEMKITDPLWSLQKKKKHASRLPQGLEMGMIMCQTPNLECLTIAKSDKDMLSVLSLSGFRRRQETHLPLSIWPLVAFANGKLSDEVHSFRNLRMLILNMRGMRSEPVSLLLRLPSLQDFILDELQDLPSEDPDDEEEDMELEDSDDADRRKPIKWKCPAGTSTVSRLRFSEARTSKETLGRFIGSCKRLEVFSYSQVSESRSFHEGRYEYVIKALGKHKSTLKYLEVEDDLWTGARNHLGPLNNFECLKYVRAPLTLVFGAPRSLGGPKRLLSPAGILPQSLETLRLHLKFSTEDPNLPKWLASLVPACSKTLQNVVIDFWSDAFELDRESGSLIRPEVLKRSFAKRGVDFDYVIDITNRDIDPEEWPNDEDIASLFEELDEQSTECRKHAHDERCDVHTYQIPLPVPLRELRSKTEVLEVEFNLPPNRRRIVRCGLRVEHPEAEDEDEDGYW